MYDMYWIEWNRLNELTVRRIYHMSIEYLGGRIHNAPRTELW